MAEPILSHRVANVLESAGNTPPPGKRVPFGWEAMTMPATIGWEAPALAGGWLRVTIASDVREQMRLRAIDVASGGQIGVFDIRYGSSLQPFEIPVKAGAITNPRAGIRLELEAGEQPLLLLTGQHAHDAVAAVPPELSPHFLPAEPAVDLAGRRDAFDRATRSLASIQPLGWLEGCVLDGLLDARDDAALRRHLSMYYSPEGRWVFESPRSEPADGGVHGIEETLPVAALSTVWPNHPAVEASVQFWLSRADDDDCVLDGRTTSAEGSYTVAYPMAMIGKMRRDERLLDLAATQLRVRGKRLWARPDSFYLRHSKPKRGETDVTHTFCNWSRGIAWHVLGMARTLRVLGNRPGLDDLRDQLLRTLDFAIARRGEDGLWAAFAGEPDTGPDTSGSAGIAAAIAITSQLGLRDGRELARCTCDAIEKHLTPDGLLGGVVQLNRSGEPLQRGGYRTIAQFAMGLLLQARLAM